MALVKSVQRPWFVRQPLVNAEVWLEVRGTADCHVGSVVKGAGSRWRWMSCARRAWPAVTDVYHHHTPVSAPTVCPLVIHPAPWAAGCASALAVGRGVGGIYRGCGDGVALRA